MSCSFSLLRGDLAVFRNNGVINAQICHRTTMVQQWLKSFWIYHLELPIGPIVFIGKVVL